jgi:molybdenum cofactor cytidylyltransferase
VSIAAVILAAGFSRRLGRAKQSVEFAGEMLVERAVRVAREAGLMQVIVVVNREAGFCEVLQGRGCVIVLNELAEEGMASSIRRGVSAAVTLRASGVVLMTCDQVELEVGHLQGLLVNPGRIAGSGYAGRVGIPAYFPAAAFGDLLVLQGDTGAKELLKGERVVVEERLAVDVDTEEDLAKLFPQ